MQTCETCRHWVEGVQFSGDYNPNGNAEGHRCGECRGVQTDPRFWQSAFSDLVTRSDFGCIAHEPRE